MWGSLRLGGSQNCQNKCDIIIFGRPLSAAIRKLTISELSPFTSLNRFLYSGSMCTWATTNVQFSEVRKALAWQRSTGNTKALSLFCLWLQWVFIFHSATLELAHHPSKTCWSDYGEGKKSMIGTFPISKYKMKSTFDHLSSTKTNVSFHKAIVWLKNIVWNTSH